MNISEAIDMLQESELKQLKIKENKKAVMGFINMGVLELHKRFVLWQSEAIITMVAGVTEYKLDGTDTNVAIDLSDHQFLHLDEAYDDDGESMSINDESDVMGIATPRWNVVEIPPDGITDGVELDLIYRAAPNFHVHEKEIIPLPPQMFEALFLYVGFRAHSGTKNNPQTENNQHYKKFDTSCNRIKIEGLYTEDSLNSSKFRDSNFV